MTSSNENSGVTLVHDPSGIFSSGACFNFYDLAFGVLEGAWAHGTVFDVGGHTVKLVGSVPVRDDGAILECRPGHFAWKQAGG